MARGVVGWMRAHDPSSAALHKAVKVAVVVTAGLALGTAAGNDQLSLFASFGGVAFLLFADFPGSRSARLGAYLGLAAAGLVLIALGTLCSPVGALAVAGMAVVGFAVLFCGVLSAALAGATRAALLAFILPVMVPATPADIPARWAGWLLAAVLAIPAAVLAWPPRDHDRLRRTAAAACAALADQLDAGARGAGDATRATGEPDSLRSRRQASVDAVAEFRGQFRSTNVRPVGLTAGSRQLMRLLDRLEWLRTVIDRLPSPVDDGHPDERSVHDACAATLRSAAAVLDDSARRPSFTTRQELSVRLRSLQELHLATPTFLRLVRADGAATPDGARAGSPLHPATMLELVYTTRLTGLTVAASASADARPLLDRLVGRNSAGTPEHLMLPVRKVLAGHLSRRSVWFQNSLRGALGLAIAVAIAEITEVSHGFWVVLGAMSVLRTTALTTGSTAVRALSGTVIGFAVGSVIMLLVGTTAWHLWLLLPITLLVAGYLPEAVSFTAGQAAFTVLVVVLFNIIAPVGWLVGLVRIEDVLLGCASALVSGVLLWPRGAAAAIRSALAEFYRAASDAVVAATDRLVGQSSVTTDSVDAAMAAAASASLRFDDALREYLFERGTRSVPLDALTALSNGAGRTRMTAEAIAGMPALRNENPGDQGAFARSAEAVAVSAAFSRAWFVRLAERLEHPGGGRTPLAAPAEPGAEATVIADARRTVAGHPASVRSQPLVDSGRILWSSALYLDNICRVQRRLIAPAGQLLGLPIAATTSGPPVQERSGNRP